MCFNFFVSVFLNKTVPINSSYITLKINGPGWKDVIYSYFSFDCFPIFTNPNEVYINKIKQEKVLSQYYFNETDNEVILIWNVNVTCCNVISLLENKITRSLKGYNNNIRTIRYFINNINSEEYLISADNDIIVMQDSIFEKDFALYVMTISKAVTTTINTTREVLEKMKKNKRKTIEALKSIKELTDIFKLNWIIILVLFQKKKKNLNKCIKII